MKKTLAVMAAMLAFGMCMAGCAQSGKEPDDIGGGQTPGEQTPGEQTPGGEQNPGGEKEPLLEYDRYQLKTYLTPFWEGKTVYNETLWFAGDDSYVAPLMYAPDEILSVTSYDLKTVYKAGVDYIWSKGTPALGLTDDTSIPHMSRAEYYDGTMAGLFFSEGPTISLKQVCVTYTHSDSKQWTLPRGEKDKFPKTFGKLEKGEALNVVFYGDSITVGANSSSYVQIAPNAESYPEMVRSYMQARYPQATVNYINTAVGGTDSNWGNDGKMNHDLDNLDGGAHFQSRVLDKDPDLLFIAFGMNDNLLASAFQANIRSMIERARAAKPEVEIVLVSGMTANPDMVGYYNKYAGYEQALVELTEDYDRVGVATVYSSVDSLNKAGKRFRDWTGNNINHPNDFMSRLYAQTIVYTLFGEDYIEHI